MNAYKSLLFYGMLIYGAFTFMSHLYEDLIFCLSAMHCLNHVKSIFTMQIYDQILHIIRAPTSALNIVITLSLIATSLH